jgi:fructokinase
MSSRDPSRGSAPVLVVGEALVDLVEDGARRTAIPGGSAANVALGLGRRGIPVRLATHLGRDGNGELIAGFLAADGVVIDPSSFTAERTSTAIARRDATGDVGYEFDVGWVMPEPDLADPVSLVHLGSFPAFEPDPFALMDLLARLPRRMPVSWDPNVRPALIADRAAAQRRFAMLCPEVDVLKLSDADADYLLPGLDPDAVADRILDAGVRLAVVTLAEHGLLVANRAARARVSAVATRVVDTIGAGDTIMASLIADVVEGRALVQTEDDLGAIGRRAAAAAAITVARAGADLPRSSELARAAGFETFASSESRLGASPLTSPGRNT